ncbi:MAG: hemolysin family protein [Microscillaceae bacterium]|nr:hemolysin family protein [Microscillaceae bacterium]
MNLYEIFHIVILLLLWAFFSGTEIAFVSANKLYFELQKKQGVWSGIIISHLLKKPSIFISILLIGNTIILVLYGYFMASLLSPYASRYLPLGITQELGIAVVSTLLVLITAEFLPKTTFMMNPDRILEILAIPIWVVYHVLYWPVYMIVLFSKFLIVHLFKLNYSEDEPVFGLVDLNNYIINNTKTESETESPQIDPKIFNRAISFKEVKVRDCMIPRTEIEAVEIHDSIEKLRKAFVESGHSKILVYKNNIDDIVGYCHSLELFKKPQDIASILTNIIILPETTQAQELLIRFISEHKSIALVVDEFGGTSGIVTLEDVVEEIFGEIQDEYDQEDWVEHQIDPYNYILSARHEIDDLNEKYGWNLPQGDYDTLGGFILSITENIPKMNDVIVHPPFTFTILNIQYSRIDTVKLQINKEYQDQLNDEPPNS